MSGFLNKVCENFDLNNGISPVYFWKSEWEQFDPSAGASVYSKSRPASISPLYLAYRFMFMAYFLVVTIQNLLCDPYLYFIYLTNISFTIQLLYATLYFLVLFFLWLNSFVAWPELDPEAEQTQRLLGRRDESEEKGCLKRAGGRGLPLVCKLIWILVNITGTIPYGVSFVYWMAIYDGAGSRPCENVFNYYLHASNVVLALVDGLIIAIPIRVSHVLFPFLTGLAYVIFTILYEVFSGVYKGDAEYIYSIIDWRNAPANAALGASLVLLAACLIHLVLCWGLSRLRVYLVRRFFSQ